ncbi:FAD dependent oxidoreductase [Gorgonomyces haynaldii]|nr:FAD dependent oxidoreductase [Gorgonomyces haynaldii]
MFLVVGGGTFGLSTVLHLLKEVDPKDIVLFDRSEIPAPDASSTDINKIVRPDYGDDIIYTRLALDAQKVFRVWNEDSLVYHETGVAFFNPQMHRDCFEAQSVEMLKDKCQLGPVKPMQGLQELYEAMPDGYINYNAGWADSGKTIQFMHSLVKQKIKILTGSEGTVIRLTNDGLETKTGSYKGSVILCSGAWSRSLLDLSDVLVATGQPVIHFNPPKTVIGPQMVWTANITKTGFYGFPSNKDGLIKVAKHSAGYTNNLQNVPSSDTPLPVEALLHFRRFFDKCFPYLNQLDIAKTRMCWYTDTFDGDFLITRYPSNPNIVLATGGSGHAFKFAPVIGRIVVDVIMNRTSAETQKFGWRTQQSKSDCARAPEPRKDLGDVSFCTDFHLKASSYSNGTWTSQL